MYKLKQISDCNLKELDNFIGNKISNFGQRIIISKNLKKNNLSFALFSGNKIMAFCPFFFEDLSLNKKKWKQGSLFELSLPSMIISNDIGDKEFRTIVSMILDEIDKLGIKNSISNLKVCFSDVINFNLESKRFQILHRLLLKYKYLNISLTGNRIDLRNDINIIIKSISKGHKAIINKTKYKILFYGNKDKKINFKDFQILVNDLLDHEQMVPLLYELYNNSFFEFCEIFDENTKVGYAGFCTINDTVEYFISRRINENINSHHVMVYEAIKRYKNNKFSYLDLGVVSYGPQLHYLPSKKKLDISIFKRGFKGDNYPLVIFEKFYSKELFEKIQSERIKNFLNQHISI